MGMSTGTSSASGTANGLESATATIDLVVARRLSSRSLFGETAY
jgi:hypothetical protein